MLKVQRRAHERPSEEQECAINRDRATADGTRMRSSELRSEVTSRLSGRDVVVIQGVSPELDAQAVVAVLLADQPEPPDRSFVPDQPGFYAWWANPANLTDADPPIPAVYPPGSSPEWSLLYVGIAPKRPSQTGVDRTIAARISKDHRGGNIGGSTFRQSLASILRTSLALSPKHGHDRARLVDESPLSQWIDATCGLTTAATATPSRIEDDVVRTLGAPLNLRPGYHEFRFVVEEARRALRRDCAA